MPKKSEPRYTYALPLVITKLDGYYRLLTLQGNPAGPRILHKNPPDIPDWRFKTYQEAEAAKDLIYKHHQFTLPGNNV